MSRLKYLLKYIKYKLFSRHSSGFGIHSPFLYNLIIDVINDFTPYYAMDDIWEIREDMLMSNHTIKVTDFGAGSKIHKSNERKIKDIAKYSSVNMKLGELLFRIVVYFKPKIILEMGTSIGLGTMYLAMPSGKSTVYTIEACPEISQIAKNNFDVMDIKNIIQIEGKFDDKLPKLLPEIDSLDFVFFDGNHRKKATLKYFEMCLSKINNETVFVFDDIHWSDEMEEAWEIIKKNPKVKLTVDLFFFGIVFFRKGLSKENFKIRF